MNTNMKYTVPGNVLAVDTTGNNTPYRPARGYQINVSLYVRGVILLSSTGIPRSRYPLGLHTTVQPIRLQATINICYFLQK